MLCTRIRSCLSAFGTRLVGGEVRVASASLLPRLYAQCCHGKSNLCIFISKRSLLRKGILMSQQDYLTTPEFVFQRENIYRHRLNRRKSGFLLLPLGIVLLAIPMTVGIASLAQHAYAPHLFEIVAGACCVRLFIRDVLFFP